MSAAALKDFSISFGKENPHTWQSETSLQAKYQYMMPSALQVLLIG